MKYILDVFVKEKYNIDIKDEEGNPLPADSSDPQRADVDYEVYGEAEKNVKPRDGFSFTLNKTKFYPELKEDGKTMITLKMKRRYRIEVKDGYNNCVDKESLEWTGWQLMDKGDDCHYVMGGWRC